MTMIFGCSREAAAKRFPELFAPDFLDQQGKQRQHVAMASVPFDPANFGLAVGLRAMKARLAKRTAKGNRPVGTAARAPVPRSRGSRRVDVDVALLRAALAGSAPTAEKPERTTLLWAVACHEAGHAVVAARLGMTVDSVSVVPFSLLAGLCLMQGGTRAAHVTMAFAGHLAEEQATGRTVAPSRGDERNIKEWIHDEHPGFYQGALRDAMWSRCRTQAKRLVDTHWPTIVSVADAVYGAGELSGDRLARLLRE